MVERVLMRNAVLGDPKVLALAILILVAIALIVFKGRSYYMMSYYTQQPADKGDITVYGSKTCPWCVKQEDYLTKKGIPYTFVDCKAGQCPEFVQGFPTLSVNGEIKSGYTEL
jgi:glutaredoxin